MVVLFNIGKLLCKYLLIDSIKATSLKINIKDLKHVDFYSSWFTFENFANT